MSSSPRKPRVAPRAWRAAGGLALWPLRRHGAWQKGSRKTWRPSAPPTGRQPEEPLYSESGSIGVSGNRRGGWRQQPSVLGSLSSGLRRELHASPHLLGGMVEGASLPFPACFPVLAWSSGTLGPQICQDRHHAHHSPARLLRRRPRSCTWIPLGKVLDTGLSPKAHC